MKEFAAFLFYIIVNGISLVFGMLVRQNKLFKDVTLSVFHYFSDIF